MRWNRDRRDDNAARLIRGYFERQIDRVEVPPAPHELRRAVDAHRRVRRTASAPPFTGALPNLVCALALTAGIALVAVTVGRPSPLAGRLEAEAVRNQWTTLLPNALESAHQTIAASLNGG